MVTRKSIMETQQVENIEEQPVELSERIVKLLTQFGKMKRGVAVVTIAHRAMIPVSTVQAAMDEVIEKQLVVTHGDSGDISLAKS